MRPPLLFLSHRIPYPPDKGDKIRSYHIFDYLAQRYRIFLGTFIDDPIDWERAEALQARCAGHCIRPLDGRMARLRSLRGLLTGEPLTLPYYRDRILAQWVAETVAREGIGHAMVYSSGVAQFIDGPRFRHLVRVVDLVDVDSDKWRQYARRTRGPARWIYAREARRLLEVERGLAARFDATLLVSEAEADLLRRLAPEVADRIHGLSNGVDLDAYDPTRGWENPYQGPGPHLVFTGAMDYRPNIDAVTWFADEVLPEVRRRHPGAWFHIVGSRPAEAVQALAGRPGIQVTGRVPEVQPWLAHADAVVAPMRIARGIQNKVLEGMAMARPVVVTAMGLEGIDAVPGEEVLVADDAATQIQLLDDLLARRIDGRALGAAARRRVERSYAWSSTLPLLDRWFDGRGREGA